jgi:hypothetical protein
MIEVQEQFRRRERRQRQVRHQRRFGIQVQARCNPRLLLVLHNIFQLQVGCCSHNKSLYFSEPLHVCTSPLIRIKLTHIWSCMVHRHQLSICMLFCNMCALFKFYNAMQVVTAF